MKKLFFAILSFYSLSVFSQNENNTVLEALQKCKEYIASKQYQEAKITLEDNSVFEVYTDSIDYYMKVIDYHVDLDSVEVLYQKKRFQEARDNYNKLYPKHKNVILATPIWILRCDTIIEAQKRGTAISPEIVKKDLWKLIVRPQKKIKDGFFVVYLGNPNYYSVYDKSFNKISDISVEYMADFPCGLSIKAYYRSYDNGIYYITPQGKEMKCNYYAATDFSEGLAAVQNKKGYWGYINTQGREVIRCQFLAASPFSEGLARVVMKNDVGNYVYAYIDKSGEIVINGSSSGIRIDKKYNFSEGLAFDNTSNCIDKQGNIVFKLKSDYIPHNFSCGLASVAIGKNMYNAKYGYINTKGEEIISLKYDYATDFSENYAWVRVGKKMGCINQYGDWVIRPIYEEYEALYFSGYREEKYKFKGGLACVKKGEKWGYVDVKGNVIIPFCFDDAWGFSEGFAWVKKDGKWGMVDKFGVSTFDYQ